MAMRSDALLGVHGERFFAVQLRKEFRGVNPADGVAVSRLEAAFFERILELDNGNKRVPRDGIPNGKVN
jgi:hypothetical protein